MDRQELEVEVSEMKECPFCGTRGATVQTDATGGYAGRWEWGECGNCGARGPEERINTEKPSFYARQGWNKRKEQIPTNDGGASPISTARTPMTLPHHLMSCPMCGGAQHINGAPCPAAAVRADSHEGPHAFRGRNSGVDREGGLT